MRRPLTPEQRAYCLAFANPTLFEIVRQDTGQRRTEVIVRALLAALDAGDDARVARCDRLLGRVNLAGRSRAVQEIA